MKKVLVFVAISIIAIVFIISCKKDNENVDYKILNQIKSNSIGKKIGGLKTSGYSGNYSIGFLLGHDTSVCHGKCVQIGDISTHVSCQGYGSNCNSNINITINKLMPYNDNDPYFCGISDNLDEQTHDSIYYMPNRSIFIENTDYENGFIWLNIPEQILKRDIINNKFIYNNITFTSNQLFDNL